MSGVPRWRRSIAPGDRQLRLSTDFERWCVDACTPIIADPAPPGPGSFIVFNRQRGDAVEGHGGVVRIGPVVLDVALDDMLMVSSAMAGLVRTDRRRVGWRYLRLASDSHDQTVEAIPRSLRRLARRVLL